MKSAIILSAAILIAAGASHRAEAGPAADTFGKCLVQSSTGKDRIIFVQWLFGALSMNPNVQSFSSSTKEQRIVVARQTAAILQRLLLTDCHAEAVAAVREDGQGALSSSFEMFGRAAAQELMSDPAVQKEMGATGSYLDAAKIGALIEEAKK